MEHSAKHSKQIRGPDVERHVLDAVLVGMGAIYGIYPLRSSG